MFKDCIIVCHKSKKIIVKKRQKMAVSGFVINVNDSVVARICDYKV